MTTQSGPSPYITIVMAIRNVGAELNQSLDSFEEQSFGNIEVLIADCNSTDNPAQYIEHRSFPILHIIQSDMGIYDAWNKVLPLARGEWINFMGAGDEFATADALKLCVDALTAMPREVLMAYGQVKVIGENGGIVGSCGAPWDEARAIVARFDMFPHQATFQRRSTFNKYGYFSLDYEIAADTEMIFRLAAKRSPVFFPVSVAHFRYGGTSSHYKNRVKSIVEMRSILRAYGVPYSLCIPYFKAKILVELSEYVSTGSIQSIIDAYRVLTGRKRRY